jgi:membrane protease YdiL (CAAX protease family)
MKMRIKTRDWCTLILLAVLSFGFWYNLEYPRFAFVKLPFNKQQAITESINYLNAKGVDVQKYSRAIIFDADERFNRYFQHAAGLKAEQEFIAQNDFDLFRWVVRFFKEGQKEEYLVYLSPRSGKVINFTHAIEDLESRIDPGKDGAKQKAEMFLQKTFGTDLDKYAFHEEKVKRYENRIEYVFSWEKKNVYIPWKQGKGVAKLLTEITVSGDEIRDFTKNKFELPEEFLRYVQKQSILGEYLYNIFYIFLFVLLAAAISIVLKNRQNIVPRLVKGWFYSAALFLIIINAGDFINNLQYVFMHYPTSARLGAFLGLSVTKWLFNIGFLAVGFIMPGIAGESLRSEVLPQNPQSSFLSYIKSSFLNRGLTQAILLGYLVWVIMLGMQAVIFYNGQKFLGVWKEWYMMTYFSSAYIPIFSAFVIAIGASLNEEIIFRLFGISFVKKYLRSLIPAVLVTSVIWGMGHTMYAIFPVWFRIIEITLIGIFYGFIFIRFGIIPLIVAHYLFDAFWCSAAYLLGQSYGYLFYSAVGLLSIPLIFAFGAYFFNRTQQERAERYVLDKIQEYNLGILITFIAAKRAQGVSAELIQEELLNNNWDHLLVNLAIAETSKA